MTKGWFLHWFKFTWFFQWLCLWFPSMLSFLKCSLEIGWDSSQIPSPPRPRAWTRPGWDITSTTVANLGTSWFQETREREVEGEEERHEVSRAAEMCYVWYCILKQEQIQFMLDIVSKFMNLMYFDVAVWKFLPWWKEVSIGPTFPDLQNKDFFEEYLLPKKKLLCYFDTPTLRFALSLQISPILPLISSPYWSETDFLICQQLTSLHDHTQLWCTNIIIRA